MLRRTLTLSLAALALAGCSGSSSPTTVDTPVVDASNPPAPIGNGQQPAPPALADAILQPVDLGDSWRTVEDPPISIRTPPPFAVGPPTVYEVHSNLQAEHWDGSTWVTDQSVQEIATSYGTADNAQQEVQLQVLNGHSLYKSSTVSGIEVWQFVPKDPKGSVQVLFGIGPLYVHLAISPPGKAAGTVAIEKVLQLAIKRLSSHPVSA